MKFLKTALLILILCGATFESAQAGASISSFGRSSSSSAFKSGFSSHKNSVVSRSAVQPATKSTSFGSFGATGGVTAPSPASATTNSALSKNLNATAANSAALKTLDARNQAAALPAPAVGSGYATGSGTTAGYVSPPMYTQNYIPQTVIVQRNSGFSSSPFLWFMLGHSMASQGQDRVVYERPDYPAGSTINQDGGGGNPAPIAVPQEPKESFGAKLLRVVLWLMIFLALAAGVSYLLVKRAARAAISNSHYSLGKI